MSNEHYALYVLAYRALGWVYRVIAVGHLALGFAIWAGGVGRFPYPTYQPMLDLTNGSVLPWGTAIVISGTAMLIPHRLANTIGLAVGFLWFNLFSAMFVVAWYQYPGAGSTAPIPYAMLGCIHVALLTLKVAEYRTARRKGETQWTY